MRVNAFQQNPTIRPLLRPNPKPAPEGPQPSPDGVELSRSTRSLTVAGGVSGALLGAIAGAQGAAALASLAGLGAGAATLVAAGPIFREGLEQSLNGDPINDIASTCGTIAAGGFLLASVSGAAAGLAYPVGLLAPAAGPIVGGLIGASVGAYLARRAA
ncbi:hypothetical protein JST97_19290 [bacterium]|nr:hypothetical protein [bacterium]